jgi:hypothetical protein
MLLLSYGEPSDMDFHKAARQLRRLDRPRCRVVPMPPSTVNAGDVSNVISGLAGVTFNIRVIHLLQMRSVL